MLDTFNSKAQTGGMRTSKVAELLGVLNWTPEKCREYLQQIRWPDGAECPKCDEPEPYKITRKSKSKNKVTELLKCRACRKQFTATTGTMFEGSHVPLNKWFAALFFMCESNKGVSANILHRSLGISYKTATTMLDRVEAAVQDVEDLTLQIAVKDGVKRLDARVFPAEFLHNKWVQNQRMSKLIEETTPRQRVSSQR